MQVHIDIAGKYHQNTDCFLGYVDDNKHPIKAVMLKADIKRRLLRLYPDIEQNFECFHALILYLLLKDEKHKKRINAIVCPDYNLRKFSPYFEELMPDRFRFVQLEEWRKKDALNPNYSLAHRFVNTLHANSHKMKNIHCSNT